MQTELDQIRFIGFRSAGSCKFLDGKLAFELNELADSKNILYAFVVDGYLMYIGKTVQTLRKRMAGYKNPGPTQPTNIKNNGNIRNSLAQGRWVEIYAWPDNGLLHYGGFHVNLAAGLEDSFNPRSEATLERRPERASQPSDVAGELEVATWLPG